MYLFETDRLKLRELTLNDAKILEQIFSDPIAMEYYPSSKGTEATKNWIKKSQKSYEKNGFGLWAVVRKDNEQVIGDCGITMQMIDGKEEPEIGYHILRNQWGQGYATEAAEACKNYAFSTLGIEEVFSYTRAKNTASRRVAEKIGMKIIKEYSNDEQLTVVYSIKNRKS